MYIRAPTRAGTGAGTSTVLPLTESVRRDTGVRTGMEERRIAIHTALRILSAVSDGLQTSGRRLGNTVTTRIQTI